MSSPTQIVECKLIFLPVHQSATKISFDPPVARAPPRGYRSLVYLDWPYKTKHKSLKDGSAGMNIFEPIRNVLISTNETKNRIHGMFWEKESISNFGFFGIGKNRNLMRFVQLRLWYVPYQWLLCHCKGIDGLIK